MSVLGTPISDRIEGPLVHVFEVLNVDLLSPTERGFQVLVLCVPRNNLGVRTGQVTVEEHVTLVRYEQLTYIR